MYSVSRVLCACGACTGTHAGTARRRRAAGPRAHRGGPRPCFASAARPISPARPGARVRPSVARQSCSVKFTSEAPRASRHGRGHDCSVSDKESGRLPALHGNAVPIHAGARYGAALWLTMFAGALAPPLDGRGPIQTMWIRTQRCELASNATRCTMKRCHRCASHCSLQARYLRRQRQQQQVRQQVRRPRRSTSQPRRPPPRRRLP